MPPSPRQRELLHLFDTSLCPDPHILIFLSFTIFSLLWILSQSIIASQPPSPPPLRSLLTTLFLSATYATIIAIQLLDGCWLAIIYAWGLARIAKGGGGGGLVGWMVTGVVLCGLGGFLMVGFVLWIVTIWRTVKQMVRLWKRGPEGAVGSEKASALGDSE
jgi:hypothetical protein